MLHFYFISKKLHPVLEMKIY